MDFRFFFNNKFLKRTFGEFASSLDNSDYETFKDTLKKNRSWYIPASIFNTGDKTIHKLFDNIDGTTLKKDSEKLIKDYSKGKNAKLEQSEIYDWVRYNYETFTGKKITDEELKNMKMSEFMKLVEEFLNNGFEL